MRTIAIGKSGKTTTIEVKNNNGSENEFFAINKLTNIYTVGNTMVVPVAQDKQLYINYAEIENKLSAVDIKDYLIKASVLFHFNQ